MTGAVGDIGDEVEILAFLAAQQSVNGLDQHLDDVDVLPLVEAAYIVGFGDVAFVEDGVDSSGMVFDIEPVAHVLAFAIDGQGFAVAYVVYEQGYEFFGELVGAVVVGAVGDDGGQAVGVVEGSHEMVAAGFGSAVGAVGLVLQVFGEELVAVGEVVLAGRGLGGEGWLDAVGVGHGQRAIDFVGADMIEPLAFVLFGEALPVGFGGLQQAQRAHDVGLGEGERVFDATVHMALGGEVYDAVDTLCLHEIHHAFKVADVHLDELVVGLGLDVLEVGEVACIGELVEVDDLVVGVFVDEEADYVAADETGSACD